DIDWEEATHGDDQRYNKEVQKNHPFTRGNEDEVPPPITLEMENGEVEKFEKGIGTVASNPSTITYDVEEVQVEKFKSYIG
ncbi:NPCBM/NEW2 domain-containing protein, partial [Brucella melitensis]